MTVESESAQIRRKLTHPVIDGDGHWLEPFPLLIDYMREIGGPKLAGDFQAGWEKRTRGWYAATPDQRRSNRMTRTPYWTLPGNALDLSTGLIPALLNERIQEFGVDFALIFPSLGQYAFTMADTEVRRVFTRAMNTMSAELFRPYRDRLTPAALVPVFTPQEAIEEAEYAVRTLGLKVININGTVRRPLPADIASQSDPAKRRIYIDSVALDSEYDYDPFWAKCVELKTAVTTHVGSQGWADRTSPTNYVSNHLGHLAQSHHNSARNLFLGGVTERFPKLKFAFLEGGVGWGCNLMLDLVGHWKKRNTEALKKNLRPINVDAEEMRSLFERHATHPRFAGKIDEIVGRCRISVDPGKTAEELTERDLNSDDFKAVRVGSASDIRRVFSENFYFGCEADDPITAWAFNTKVNKAVLKPFFSSDITHFDVIDMRQVLAEAYEMIEDELLDEEEFRAFTFSNVVSLHTALNPDFFKGTAVQSAVEQELKGRKADAKAA